MKLSQTNSFKSKMFQNLHIFEYSQKFYVFDAISVKLTPLDAEEAKLLKYWREMNRSIYFGDNLGEKSEKIQNIIDRLVKKGFDSKYDSRIAGENPPYRHVQILVNISQLCNLKCNYCFTKQGKFGYEEERVSKLSPNHARKLINVLPKGFPWADSFTIHFYGGEPLLNLPAMQAAVDEANEIQGLKLNFAITTNGTIATKEAISLLNRGKFNIILSIDGPAFIHDECRRTQNNEPTHARVMNFLNKIRENSKLYVRASSVVRRGWSLHEAHKYQKSLDVHAFKAQAVRLSPDNPMALNEGEREEYKRHLSEIADEVIAYLHQEKSPRDDRFNHRVLQVLRGTRRTSFCGAGMSSFGIAADGTVYPCALLAGLDGMTLGNLDEPVTNWVERGRIWASNHGPRKGCESCWALPLCGGGCPAMLHVCGEDECDFTRTNCELALSIYGEFFPDNLDKLLYLGNISWNEDNE